MDETLFQNTQEQTPEPQKKSFFRKYKGPIYSMALFASAFLTALFLNAFVFQPYEVEGSSMEHTLQKLTLVK